MEKAMPTQSTPTTPATVLDDLALEKIRSGQRLIMFAILANIICLWVSTGNQVLYFIAALIPAAMAIVGLMRLASGFKYGWVIKFLLVILQFIPLLNIITLVVLSSRATTALRAAGYMVGLLGAAARA